MATITTVKERIDQLDQASFQILCDAFLAREGYPNLVALGTKAGSQKTTPGTPDTYFCITGGKYVFAEYTTQKASLVSKIRSDIYKCLDVNATGIALDDIVEIVYCHTSSNITPSDDLALKAKCEAAGIKLTLYGVDILAEKLMKYPALLKDHLNLTIDTEQIQSIEDFVGQYNSNGLAATLGTDFMFREKEIEAVDDAFRKVDIVLLTGPAGTGKTRLALEYAKKHSQEYGDIPYCIHDRSLPLYEDLVFYFEKPGKYFVLVDDANQLSEIKHVVEYVNKAASGYQVKVLITVRDYALQKVKSDISGIAPYETVPIDIFKDDQISSLMQHHYNIHNSRYLERINQIAEGNARIAMLAGKIACEANRLDAIKDVTALYEGYYGKAIHDAGLDADNALLISAGIMAFLNAIHLDRIAPIMPILASKGISTETFVEKLHVLHQHEIVDICNDKGVRFSEQCLSNFVLKYVFYDKKIISLAAMIEACFDAYRGRTIQSINTLLRVFPNEDLYAFTESEICSLWNRLSENNSPMFFPFLTVFFRVNQLDALLILKERIENAEQVFMNVDEINTEDGKNYQNVRDDVIKVLGGFADTENIDAALDLFFQYYLKRPDMYMQFYHASTTFFSVDRHSEDQGYAIQIKYFTKIIQYADNWKNPFITLLFLDVANELLKLEFTPCESGRNDRSMVIYHIPVSLTAGSSEFHRIVWEQIQKISAIEGYRHRVDSILKNYGKTIHECSKAVVRNDAPFICKIITSTFSPDVLADCLIVDSVCGVFSASDYKTSELDFFLHSPKMEVYRILKGPKWDFDFPYEEHEALKKKCVLEYYQSASDHQVVLRNTLCVHAEISRFDRHELYTITDSINTILKAMDDPEEIVSFSRMVLAADVIEGIAVYLMLDKLFSVMSAANVLEIIKQGNPKNINEFTYAYYHQLPDTLIDNKAVTSLYDFLRDDSDRTLQGVPRDIDFLEKYISVDSDVFITASRIILDKRIYAPFIVGLYFGLQFNEHHIQPQKLIKRFDKDISLLEEIYLCLSEGDRIYDYRGLFLHEMFANDKEFVKKYAKWYLKKEANKYGEDSDRKVSVFYQEENYIEVLDSIVDELFATEEIPFYAAPRIIKLLLSHSDAEKDLTDKQDAWVRHYIETNCNNRIKMECLFEAISELSMAWLRTYIEVFCAHNPDYEVFKHLPLTPRSSSCFGSWVPVYSSWVDCLKTLLPLFPGLQFIRHKKRVEDLISGYQEAIREEEISDILNG